jgi:hypothetical protein
MPEPFVYDWMVSRRLLTAATTLLAAASLVTGVLMWAQFHAEAVSRVDNGVRVDARVVFVGRFSFGRGSGREITVDYAVDDAAYTTRLMSLWTADGSYRMDETTDVYIDPTDPHCVAMADGFISEDRLVVVPYALCASSTVLFIFLAIGLARRRKRTRSAIG